MPADDKFPEVAIAHPGERRSFQIAEEKAREVLQERGLSESQIDRELHRCKRDEED